MSGAGVITASLPLAAPAVFEMPAAASTSATKTIFFSVFIL